MDSAAENMLTLFIGIMFGVNAAQMGVSRASVLIAAEVTKKLPQRALTKGTIYPIVKKVAGAMSMKMTKQVFARGVSKAVPVIGAVVSGSLTLATFFPMARRLQQHLRTLPLTHPNLSAQQSFGFPTDEIDDGRPRLPGEGGSGAAVVRSPKRRWSAGP